MGHFDVGWHSLIVLVIALKIPWTNYDKCCLFSQICANYCPNGSNKPSYLLTFLAASIIRYHRPEGGGSKDLWNQTTWQYIPEDSYLLAACLVRLIKPHGEKITHLCFEEHRSSYIKWHIILKRIAINHFVVFYFIVCFCFYRC